MVLVSTREFRTHQKKYFDIAVHEKVVVKRGKLFFSIVASSKPDSRHIDYEWLKEYNAIPDEYRCDPFAMSPSGDLFYADRRNVEKVKQTIEQAEQEIKEGKTFRMLPNESLDDFLKRIEQCTR
jgi:hypothetical protein